MKERYVEPDHYAGFRVNKNIYNAEGVLVVPAKTILFSRTKRMIARQHIRLSDKDIEPVPVLELIRTALLEVRLTFRHVRDFGRIPVERVGRYIVPLVVQLSQHPDLNALFSELEKKDEYTYRHSIGVALIAHLIGRAVGMGRRELLELTSEAFLHDVGKVRIPEHILHKPGKLTDKEFEVMRRHTIYGYEILSATKSLSPRHALVALQHHEREDGSGYPHGLTGDAIDCHSKIVAIADVFHAMISKRVYKKPVPLYQVLSEMASNAYGRLEPAATLCFLQRIMELLVGNRVALSNGRQGKVVLIHAHDPIRPLIESDGAYVDLSKERTIRLERIL